MVTTMIMPYDACLFDMDGVLVDSEPAITKAAMLGLAEYGVEAREEDFKPFTGMGEDRFVGGVAEQHGVPYRPEMKKAVYNQYLTIVEEALTVYPGTLPTLEALRQGQLRLALASSADQVKVQANLRVAGIAPATFGALLCGEDVQHKKPHPDIYLEAAKRLGIPPRRCVVVEDALSGVQAAKAAGCACIGITTSFEAGALERAGADYVVGCIEEILPILLQS